MSTAVHMPENDLVVKLDIGRGSLLQIWKCAFCGNIRQWGLLWPVDRSKPLLTCHVCRHPMRHEFAGVMSPA